MAGSFSNGKDSVDINELASLNEDISDDMIEQLQQQLTQNLTGTPQADVNDDSTLFEEVNSDNASVPEQNNAEPEFSVDNKNTMSSEGISSEGTDNNKKDVAVNTDFDDNFIKKYKAKLKNKQNTFDDPEQNTEEDSSAAPSEQIEALSQGNITEKPMTQELREYNDSLDFLDGNVKYSKYVMYIDPENVDFIESLTVKERKNLINKVLRQQDDIAITKKKFRMAQGILNHIIIAILTLAISIPVVYYAINASLEATINNHRNAQSNWQTLYKEHGKITQN